MIVPWRWTSEWRVEGVTLFDDNGGKIKPEDRSASSTTHLKVWAKTAAEAEEKFAAAFKDDVRVTKMERVG